MQKFLRTISKNTFSSEMSLLTHKHFQSSNFYGMNSQFVRASILIGLLNKLSIDAFVETGTFKGATAFLIAMQSNVPVYTCDINKKFNRIAKINLLPLIILNKVKICFKDSPSFLENIFLGGVVRKPFVYLDAHWEKELPLRKELIAVLNNLKDFVVIIDDFKVPHDDGFKYDCYNNVCLEFNYVKDIFETRRNFIRIYFPSYSSSVETGAKAGWCLITSGIFNGSIEKLVPNTLLKEFSW